MPAWRLCSKCLSLFWNRLPHNGYCPAAGPHSNFSLKCDLCN